MFRFAPHPQPPLPVTDDHGDEIDLTPPTDDPYALSAGVGRDAPNRRDDVLRVETVLSRLGRFDATPTGGPTGYPGMRLVESLTGLQKDHGLTVDGRALPGGETLGAMRTEDVVLGGTARQPVFRTGEASATQHPFRQQAQSLGTASKIKAMSNAPSLLHLTAAEWPQPESSEVKQQRARENEPGGTDNIARQELMDVVLALADGMNIRKEAVQRAGPEILGTLIEIEKLPYLTTDEERDHVLKMIDQWDHREFGNLAHQLKKAANYQVGQPNPLPASMSEEQLRAAIETRKRELLLLGLLGAGTSFFPGAGALAKLSASLAAANAIAGYAGDTPYHRELDRRKAGHVGPMGSQRPSKRR